MKYFVLCCAMNDWVDAKLRLPNSYFYRIGSALCFDLCVFELISEY